VSEYVGKADSLEQAIRHHTLVQVERIMSYPHVAEKMKKGDLLVKPAYYDVNYGQSVFIGINTVKR
jgi:carbonic anhydrase